MTFVTEAALIALREGLEALLITGILLGLVARLGHRAARKHIWAGFLLAAGTSVAAGWAIQRFILDRFEEGGGAEWFELVAALAAVAILTYMIVWMWQHTRSLMTTLRGEVEKALGAGTLFGIVFLTYASVIREGLEVVLFYSALATRFSPFDLAWSGLVGFAVSALLVAAILRGTSKVDLQKFFGITGVLLVFVAAGLLVHSVGAATGLGLLEPAPSIWDTSAMLSDDSALGRVLHALIGYTATPTLLQGLLYFGYVFGLGGWYLWSLGAFHTRATGARAAAPARIVAAGIVVLLVAAAVGTGAANPGAVVEGHSHGSGESEAVSLASLPEGQRFGVLLRSHGEPIHYNETTYQSFADFVENLLVMFGMENLLLVDQGTVLLDKAHPWDRSVRNLDAEYMDAWTHAQAGPAAYVGSPVPQVKESQVPFYDGFYLMPGGPGLGEPDILEMAGLGIYLDWLQMEGQSPMHFTKGLVLAAAQAQLEARYGDRVVVQKSYHIQPKLGGPESDEEAMRAFQKAGVSLVIDAYTSSVFSDVMNTCMMRPHLEHAAETAGYRGRVVHAEPSGPTHTYAHAAAAEVAARLAETPPAERVAVFLTHHGATPGSANPCGSGVDRYHADAARLFELTKKAIAEETGRDDVLVFQVYGQGAGAADDGVLSPKEALRMAREAGATGVLDLPYELTGNGFDNLVAQRHNYGLPAETAPHYDANHETRLVVQGMNVRILSSAFGADARGGALVEVVEHALAEALGGHEKDHEGDAGHDHEL